VPGVKLNAEISKELLQTIFQPKTLLHDGATLIRGSRIMAAGAPFSTKHSITPTGYVTEQRWDYRASRKLYLCGRIRRNWFNFFSRQGTLNRPLTSSKLKELLDDFLPSCGTEAVAPVCSVCFQISTKVLALGSRLLGLPSSASREKK